MAGGGCEQCMKFNSCLLPPLIIKSVGDIKKLDPVLDSEQKKGEKQQGSRKMVRKSQRKKQAVGRYLLPLCVCINSHFFWDTARAVRFQEALRVGGMMLMKVARLISVHPSLRPCLGLRCQDPSMIL